MKNLFQSVLFLIVISTTFFGCSGCFDNITRTATDITNQISQQLDKSISELSAQSANWQEILNNTIKNLPEETSDLIRGDINNLLQRTVAAAGSEIRCDADFFRIRVQQGLQHIKNKLLNLPSDPLEPHFCSDVPTAIDMSLDPNSRNKLEFFGYDFDKTKQEVYLVSGSTSVNVSQFLDQTTHFHLILNLGSNGVRLDKNSQRIVLKWNNQEVSSIPVIQPLPEICETEFKEIAFATSFIPPKSGTGDNEFDGHGPNIICRVNLINYHDRVAARIYMSARETKSDFTSVAGTFETDIYFADPGKTIEKIVSSTDATWNYIDTNVETDLFNGNGCVKSFKFLGDTPGDDVGETNVSVVFNNIRLQLKEAGNCVSSETIKSLILQRKISPALQKKLHRHTQL
jgi:hypothetical protein